MAIYTVITREVFVIGRGWYGQRMAYSYQLPKDIVPDREVVQAWLNTHSGDFAKIDDFAASIGAEEIPWLTEDSAWLWQDAFQSEAGDEN